MFTKIILSPAEQNAVKTPEYILTKNRIISKVYDLFGLLATDYMSLKGEMKITSGIFQPEPKIFKGENYDGLPYVMLDYPRHFEKEHICAIRSFFWWGNYFSITLHLKGRYKHCIDLNTLQKTGGQWLYYSGQEEWNHHLQATNTLILMEENFEQIQTLHSGRSFCKIAQKIDLDHWEDAGHFFQAAWIMLLKSLDFNHLNGE